MKFIQYIAIAFVFSLVVLVPSANVQAATIEDMLAQIQTLMLQIENLQKQLGTVKSEVKSIIKDGLEEGMTDEDIKKIQEILATDESIYPEGRITGYFGPLTKEAVKRFQKRHELEITGEINDETRELLEEYLGERFNDKIPAGLLKAPGIMKKVEDRFEKRCDEKKAMGPFCKKLKERHGNSNDSEDEEDTDEKDNENNDRFDVEVEIEDEDNATTTTVAFRFESKRYSADVDGTDADDVLTEVADELNVDVDELDEDLVDEILEELEDELDDNMSSDDAEDEDEDEDD